MLKRKVRGVDEDEAVAKMQDDRVERAYQRGMVEGKRATLMMCATLAEKYWSPHIAHEFKLLAEEVVNAQRRTQGQP